MSKAVLMGKRVLVAEDEFLVAMLVEDVLVAEGCVVIGPFARVAEALAAAESVAIDVAVLDVNLGGEQVFPVALTLERRGVPFVFVTGYGQKGLPADRPGWQAVDKPFEAERLAQELATRLDSGGEGQALTLGSSQT